MPQVINKSVCNMVLERFVGAVSANYHICSLYFNVATHLFPHRFSMQSCELSGGQMPATHKSTAVSFSDVAFASYSVHSYEQQGIFYRLAPLDDCDEMISCALARHHPAEPFALLIAPTRLIFVGPSRVFAAEQNLCVLLVNASATSDRPSGRLTMWVSDSKGALVCSEAVSLPDSYWIGFPPPSHPGKYELRFQAELESGSILHTDTPLTVLRPETE
jgi:hypothetical protein